MIKLPNLRLSAVPRAQLETWQRGIDSLPDYPTRVAGAKNQFSQRNKRGDATFDAVKVDLTRMCSGARRCAYCEDSMADEVEHFRPKDLYPEVVFAWSNYLYACGPCNGPKNNRFSIYSPTDGLVDVTRKRNDAVVPPRAGKIALINPRLENPLDFLMLDLRNTFYFVALGKTDESKVRAEYTIELLQLNGRDQLVLARSNAYDSYRARLVEYETKRANGATTTELRKLVSSLKSMGHPTVWHEMKRQRNLIPELKALFESIPEALDW